MRASNDGHVLECGSALPLFIVPGKSKLMNRISAPSLRKA